MSYTIDKNNFSMFAKQLTKNLKEKKSSLKLSDVQEAVSKTIGFNNLHCAKKQDFKKNDVIVLTPFNNPLSQIDLAFKRLEADYFAVKDLDNMRVVVSNATIAALTLNKDEPNKYQLNISDWFNDVLKKAKSIDKRFTIDRLFYEFFNEIKKENRKELMVFFQNKQTNENVKNI